MEGNTSHFASITASRSDKEVATTTFDETRTFILIGTTVSLPPQPPHHSHKMGDHPPPTTASIAIACALVAGVTGYFLGQGKSLGLFGGSPISTPRQTGKAASDEDESSDEEGASELSEFPGHGEECKLVLVVRTDLGMTKGTVALPALRA
jgi:hypothetical protein